MEFDMPTCGGCKTCEIACSFHHTGAFGPSHSSIRILPHEEGTGYKICILEADTNEHIKACDSCNGLDLPLCVEYCKEMETLGRFINKLFNTK